MENKNVNEIYIMFNHFTVSKLKEIIKAYNLHLSIRGFSKMKKDDLINHIEKYMEIKNGVIKQKRDLFSENIGIKTTVKNIETPKSESKTNKNIEASKQELKKDEDTENEDKERKNKQIEDIIISKVSRFSKDKLIDILLEMKHNPYVNINIGGITKLKVPEIIELIALYFTIRKRKLRIKKQYITKPKLTDEEREEIQQQKEENAKEKQSMKDMQLQNRKKMMEPTNLDVKNDYDMGLNSSINDDPLHNWENKDEKHLIWGDVDQLNEVEQERLKQLKKYKYNLNFDQGNNILKDAKFNDSIDYGVGKFFKKDGNKYKIDQKGVMNYLGNILDQRALEGIPYIDILKEAINRTFIFTGLYLTEKDKFKNTNIFNSGLRKWTWFFRQPIGAKYLLLILKKAEELAKTYT